MFRHDVVLPTEIWLPSVKIQRQNKIPYGHLWNTMMNELVDLDEEILLILDALMRKKKIIAKTYNKKVKFKVFYIEDYVW